MLNKKRNLEKEIQTILKTIQLLENEVEHMKKSIGDDCTHAYQCPYTWEHDDGYGRQSLIKGKSCSTCEAIDLWNDGIWVALEDLVRS